MSRDGAHVRRTMDRRTGVVIAEENVHSLQPHEQVRHLKGLGAMDFEKKTPKIVVETVCLPTLMLDLDHNGVLLSPVVARDSGSIVALETLTETMPITLLCGISPNSMS